MNVDFAIIAVGFSQRINDKLYPSAKADGNECGLCNHCRWLQPTDK
jgi:hypothetical protein